LELSRAPQGEATENDEERLPAHCLPHFKVFFAFLRVFAPLRWVLNFSQDMSTRSMCDNGAHD
jgi:hypothetical protein